jgi:septal ring factor EnvC (AmiA/AmiB activator)
MTSSPDDRDELIKELFVEAHGLRMKNEQISHYTESKIAELVKTRRELLQVRGGIEEIVEQRNALQAQLGALTREHDQLLQMQVVMTDQRDRLRVRVAEIETSRSYRIGQRLSRFAARFSAST